jgi:TolB-like protein/class 3 adenylate cyclase
MHALERLGAARLPLLDQIAEELAGRADAALEKGKPQLREAPGDPAQEDRLRRRLPGCWEGPRVPAQPVERKLAAIFAADIVGYSRLMGEDEEGTHATVIELRREVIAPRIDEHHGRIVKLTGDGFLAEFASVVDAIRCAVEMQRRMASRNEGAPTDRRIEFRVGINIGDIIVEADDIYGDGVNIAARLEALAEPGGICVSRVVRDQVRDRLDIAFDDMGEQQVKNIARPVRVYRVRGETAAVEAAPAPAQPALPLPEKPSIAVLPFQNMSGDPEQEYFAHGMVEEIITALSRIRWLFVIARNSSFSYKGQSPDVKRVGRELGVRYVLEGSVRKACGRVRITAQLIEATTGTHLWADRFDGSLEDVFELQDQVADSVAGVIEPTLEAAEIRRSAERPTNDVTAYDLYLRALALGYSWDRNGIVRALELLEQAIVRDPRYGAALVEAASRHLNVHVSGWSKNPEASRRRGIELARQALQVAGDDPDVLFKAAYALGYFGEEIDVVIALLDRGLQLNPSFARGWQWGGWLRLWAGEPDLAVEYFETSLRLNPREQQANPFMGIGVAHFFARRLEAARAALLRSLQESRIGSPAIDFLHPVTRTWVVLTRRGKWSGGCAR